MEKTYYLIHMFFGKQNKNYYEVYKYKKSRRFTATQAWNYISHESKELVTNGILSSKATIEDYWEILDKLTLDKKTCDRYVTFGYFE